jgi:two-component system response regulator
MDVPKWILIADDDPNDRFLIGKLIKEGGVDQDLVSAQDGDEVFDCLHRRGRFAKRPSGPPAVVILDHQMPGVSGLEILRRIRNDEEFELIPVVMHSGQMLPAEVRQAYRLGANAYVEKPVNYEDLRKVFRELGIFWCQVNVTPCELQV